MYLNKVFLYGNLTRDPELKALPSGIKVTSFGIATNRTWKDKNGAKQDNTEYHNIVSFGKQAEVIAQYLKKGRGIFVEGRLQTRSWDDKETGAKKYRTEIVIDNFQFGPSGAPTGGASSYGGASSGEAQTDSNPVTGSKGASKAENLDTIEYPAEEINPEDIPF